MHAQRPQFPRARQLTGSHSHMRGRAACDLRPSASPSKTSDFTFVKRAKNSALGTEADRFPSAHTLLPPITIPQPPRMTLPPSTCPSSSSSHHGILLTGQSGDPAELIRFILPGPGCERQKGRTEPNTPVTSIWQELPVLCNWPCVTSQSDCSRTAGPKALSGLAPHAPGWPGDPCTRLPQACTPGLHICHPWALQCLDQRDWSTTLAAA